MRILVVSRKWIEKEQYKNPALCNKNWFISIFSATDATNISKAKSPLPTRSNVLKLQFDDVTEKEDNTFFHFNQTHAQHILEFIKRIPDNKYNVIFVHCDAGISRSGAVGYMLNEWFNKFQHNNIEDYDLFYQLNPQILPNPEVMRILKKEMFGASYKGIFVNDYSFNEDGEKVNCITEI